MRSIALVLAFVFGLIAPASAQKAEIEAVNAKWIEFFNKGDFAGVASLYTTDATAFPQGSAMVQGGAAIGAMFKSMAERVGAPKLTPLDVKSLGPHAVALSPSPESRRSLGFSTCIERLTRIFVKAST